MQHKKRHKNTKEAYTDGLKSIRKKVGFTAVLTDITREEALSEETTIHTPKMIAIKIALKEIHKRENKSLVIYRLFSALCSPLKTKKKIGYTSSFRNSKTKIKKKSFYIKSLQIIRIEGNKNFAKQVIDIPPGRVKTVL